MNNKIKTADKASMSNTWVKSMSKINESRLERDGKQQGIDCWQRWVVLTAVPLDRIDIILKKIKNHDDVIIILIFKNFRQISIRNKSTDIVGFRNIAILF